MAAETYDLIVDQGADWSFTIRWKTGTKHNAVPKDTTGYTARMQVREKYNSITTLVSLSTATGGVLVGSDGSFQFSLTATQTAALAPGKYVYDIEAVSPAPTTVTKILRGSFRVIPEVTR